MSKTTEESTRAGTFISKGGHLYYATAEGVVFYTTMRRLADCLEDDQAFPVCNVVGVPMEATVYTTAQDGPESRAVLAWVEAMDHHLAALAAAVKAINGEPKLPKLTVVAGA
jgi:hypothetical protein